MRYLGGSVLLFCVLLGACSTPQTVVESTVAKITENVPGIPPPLPGAPAAPAETSIVFFYTAIGGALLALFGVVALVFGAHPFLSWMGTRKSSITAIIAGACVLAFSYSFPRFEHIIASFIAAEMMTIGAVALWTLSLYLMRRWTWKSAYRIGYKEGEDLAQ